MKLVCLGVGGYHPTDLRQTACFFLPELGLLLDAGTGLYRARDWVQTPRLEIFLSHAHLDHTLGLTTLYNVLPADRLGAVTVYGDAAKLEAIQAHLFHPLLFPVRPPLVFAPLGPRQPIASGGELTCFPLEHPGGALGFRLDWPGKSLAYVTDTVARGAASSYCAAVRGVDLLLHECNFPDSRAAFAAQFGHSTPTPVAELAAAAGVKRLLLTHFDPTAHSDTPMDIASVRQVFPAAELARDGMVIDF